MSEPFLGEIKMFSFNFAPKSWAGCNGQVMSIAQNSALFSLLGTTFGGNGSTTFGLPDLRSRIPVSLGQFSGGSSYTLGQTGGAESVTLVSTELPVHSHVPAATTNAGDSGDPTGNVWSAAGATAYGASADAVMRAGVIGNNGGGQPHANMPPFLVVNFCIALQGIFPSRP